MTPTIYITGTGRSGTNITKEILGSHSQIASLPFEHRFTIDPHGIVDFYRNIENWSPYMADSKLRELATFLRMLAKRDVSIFDESQKLQADEKTGHPYAGWELNKWIPGYSNFVEELIAKLSNFTYDASYPGSKAGVEKNKMLYYSPNLQKAQSLLGTFLNQCHQSITISQGKDIFLEDNTWSILFADVLYKLTPHGRFIHMVRDPRDVIASMLNQKWTPSALENTISYYKDIIEKWQMVKTNLPSTSYVEIRLEDLISATKGTVENLCEFIGVAPEQTMYEVELSSKGRGKYKEQFGKDEIRSIELQLGNFIQQYHYT